MKRLNFASLLRWSTVVFSSLAVVVTLGMGTASALDLFGDVCKGAGASSAACSANGSNNISGANGVILRAANLISIIAGISAVLMIIISGFMFVTAAGDSSRIGNAKKTIIYSVVGLVVIVLARAIVAFIVTRVG